MTTYRLVDDGFPYKKIMSARKWVGRVGKHGAGGYFGKIGHIFVRGETERECFNEVVAQHIGFENAAQLTIQNRAVRANNRVQRAKGRAFANEFRVANLSGQIEMLNRLFSGEKT